MPETYEGPERRSGGFTVAVDLKSVLVLIGLLGPLVAVITMVLQVRQDVRGNSVRMTTMETRVQTLEDAKRRGDNALLLYCAGRREASDSVRTRLPDIGC
jgi:hypothetical protein